MSEGEPDAKATEVASPSKEVDDVAAEVADAAEAGEDTPLVGKKIEVVVKDEHEKADVTTTAVTDEGVWCIAFVIVIGHIMFEFDVSFVIYLLCPIVLVSQHIYYLWPVSSFPHLHTD